MPLTVLFAPFRRRGWPRRAIFALVLLVPVSCSGSARRLDPATQRREYHAEMVLRYEPRIADPALLRTLVPGDIVAFSSSDETSASSSALAAALSNLCHVAIAAPSGPGEIRLLSADGERGVYLESLEGCVRGREFYIYRFPEGLLDLERLRTFSERAAFLGRLDYNWSAVFGWNSNLTPNTPDEIGEEYTCATVVAASLHYSGLSLDRATWGIVTPGDIIFSIARRNLNGPRSRTERGRAGAGKGGARTGTGTGTGTGMERASGNEPGEEER